MDDKRDRSLTPCVPEHAEPVDSSQYRQSRQRGSTRGWLATAAVLAALILAGHVTSTILSRDRSAQATAEKYFNALAAGDATTANSLTSEEGLNNDTPGPLLTDEVLGGAVELISDLSVMPADDPPDAPDGAVIVTYTLAGVRYQDFLILQKREPQWNLFPRNGETAWGFLPTWELSSPYTGMADSSAQGAPLTIAGVHIDAGMTATPMFPAVYPFTVSDPVHFEAEGALIITGKYNRSIVTFASTPALVVEVQDQVDGILDACAAFLPTAASSDHCPLVVDPALAESTRGTWEIVEYPRVTIPQGSVRFSASGGHTTFSTSGGHATFTPDDGGTPVETVQGITLDGTVDVSHGVVTLER